MRRLVYLDAALDDLDGIFRYVARSSTNVEVGLRFVALLRRQCENLASLPGTMGRPRPELRPDIRSFAIKGYVIFFRVREDTFEVINILEGHRDIIGHFRDDES